VSKKNEFTAAVKQQIRDRAGDVCEICHERRLAHFHHRLMRSSGGLGTLANGMGCCHLCHAQLHANPAESYANGWLLHAKPVNTGLKAS
jgi:hypothetical protein